ncbi:MAG TPA: DNRLRE domain-containing protein [Vicinamibacterales bacterium]|nr:DNRLRE domain-containing protein [Vicinamibacterales bacterium]
MAIPLTQRTAQAQSAQTGTAVLSPADTYVGLNASNNSTQATLNTYTWPNNRVANAIIMKFDLSAVPAGAVVQSAKLKLALIESDKKGGPGATYTVTAHKITGSNPTIETATGYMSSGTSQWAPSTCCFDNIPLAQGNISQPYASVAVSTNTGFKSWTITNMVQEWLADPNSNFGVLLNSDATTGQDRYRYFASMEYPDPSLRPALEITYTSTGTAPPPSGGDPTPPPTTPPPSGGGTTPSVSEAMILPSDTTINLDANNNSGSPLLFTYTWPEYETANAILMKFDLSVLPAGATIQDATLNLALVESDNTSDATYTVTAHKIQNRNPVIESASGYTFDGINGWSASNCCYNGIPLAQGDITPPYAQLAVDKASGYKQWSLTQMVQEWTSDPSSNFGVLLNSDASKYKDRYRYFASTENGNASLRPYLHVRFSSTGGPVTPGADSSAPTVSMASPSSGATVSGNSVSVSASATDNVGVVGVQFKLDGSNLGSEVARSPYATTWNTTSAANGTHSITAVARDAAGNVRTSAPINVTVSNGTAPTAPSTPGTGISSRYPGDVGIESDPHVIFSEQFEEGSISSVASRWTSVGNPDGMRLVTDVPPGSAGGHALSIPWVGGGVNNGGSLYRVLSPGVNDVVYVRYYMKYPTSGNYHHTGMWLGGYNPVSAWPDPQAGSKPNGNDRFIAAAEQNNLTHAYEYYNYWMEMHPDGWGSYWGNFLLNNPSITANPGQWVCLEQMVKLNNPTSARNGEHAIWINGNKVSHLGQGFPNGFWDGGRFTQNPSGQPFEGFRWRSVDALNINWIWLQNYAPDDPPGFSNTAVFDHVVVATSYIGCLP